jgi:hypothetical protein
MLALLFAVPVGEVANPVPLPDVVVADDPAPEQHGDLLPIDIILERPLEVFTDNVCSFM